MSFGQSGGPYVLEFSTINGGGGISGSDRALKSSKGGRSSKEWITKTKDSVGKETRPKNIYVNWIIKAR
jgi:hypothetical protein